MPYFDLPGPLTFIFSRILSWLVNDVSFGWRSFSCVIKQVTPAHNHKRLTPSLTWYHLKTINKSAKSETLKPFCLLFRSGIEKIFAKRMALKADVLKDQNIYCFQACPCVFEPGNFTGFSFSSVLLYVHRNRRFIRDGSPGRPPRLLHSSWGLWFYRPGQWRG